MCIGNCTLHFVHYTLYIVQNIGIAHFKYTQYLYTVQYTMYMINTQYNTQIAREMLEDLKECTGTEILPQVFICQKFIGQ